MIQPADLHKVWAAPDNSRLTAKQYSFRLPVHVAAQISALCDMFPQKSRTQIVGDLLATALEGFQRSFPEVKGEYVGQDSDRGVRVFKDVGPTVEYQKLVDKYYIELEKELGTEDPKPLYGPDAFMTEDLE